MGASGVIGAIWSRYSGIVDRGPGERKDMRKGNGGFWFHDLRHCAATNL